MLDILKFIFANGWHFFGTILLISTTGGVIFLLLAIIAVTFGSTKD
jgi:hypothetical protein